MLHGSGEARQAGVARVPQLGARGGELLTPAGLGLSHEPGPTATAPRAARHGAAPATPD